MERIRIRRLSRGEKVREVAANDSDVGFLLRPRRRPSVPLNDNWAGRVTVPEPFPLTNSMSVDNIHRRKCMHEIEAAKIQKEVDDELLLSRSFKGNPLVFVAG